MILEHLMFSLIFLSALIKIFQFKTNNTEFDGLKKQEYFKMHSNTKKYIYPLPPPPLGINQTTNFLISFIKSIFITNLKAVQFVQIAHNRKFMEVGGQSGHKS